MSENSKYYKILILSIVLALLFKIINIGLITIILIFLFFFVLLYIAFFAITNALFIKYIYMNEKHNKPLFYFSCSSFFLSSFLMPDFDDGGDSFAFFRIYIPNKLADALLFVAASFILLTIVSTFIILIKNICYRIKIKKDLKEDEENQKQNNNCLDISEIPFE